MDPVLSNCAMNFGSQEYTLLEFLGEGATAQVYLAEHETSGAHVAIKVIDKLLVQRAQLESKVRQEMVLHAELQHPHVLHVEGVFEDARNYYMVLEYCARRSLSAVTKALPGRKMDEHTAKKIFRQVLMGVAYLHASGVIHRDLKLANLLLNGNGEVKISDFGLVARLGDDHVTMCGTPNFIAPEVLMAEDEPYDEAVDVWSLGCILYCLLLGKPPFEGRKVSETLENVANAGQNPLQFPDGFSSSASDLIKRLLTSMSAAFANSSSDSSSSPEDDSMIIDDYSDLSELSLPTTFNAHAESRERNEEKERPDQTDEKSLLAVSRNAGPIVSVVMHLELQDVSCLGIPQSHVIYPNDSKVQLQWSCKEPAEVGRPPTFELKVSSGWEACYDQASGVLTATTPEGDPLRYEIPGVSGARAGSSAASSSSTRITQRAYLPPLVRFCQCLALRAMQLRQIALRGHASKLPFIHYDALPESLLESFRYRSSLLTVPHQVSRPNQDLGVSVEHSTRAQKGVEIAGVGCGYIDATGDLRVVFLDGAQLTLAASGLQLRFRPSWASDVSNSASVKEDVFELLTTSSMSSFLPSAVKQKLENIPEFIRRLKAVN
ncbi:hypothetical protein PInf_002335 [Phytophthora infestans]|nr:hypothetical protein PInf_002335 [Phytophthora infestans]